MARPPGQSGLPKVGGRKVGSLSKERRKEVNDMLANDILACYAAMGGLSWLLKWAEKNESEFVRQCLARLFPAFPKSDDADVLVQQVNIGELSDLDAACRIAFVLAKGAHLQQQQEQATVIEANPDA